MIRHKVRRLVGCHGFTRSDEDDLTQELAMHAHLAAPRYEPGRGSAGAFYSAVLERRAADLARAAAAAKRDFRRQVPLDTYLERCAARDERPATERRLDVAGSLASLGAKDRALADTLVDHNLMEAARRLGLSREQARGARRRIERHFAERGLP